MTKALNERLDRVESLINNLDRRREAVASKPPFDFEGFERAHTEWLLEQEAKWPGYIAKFVALEIEAYGKLLKD